MKQQKAVQTGHAQLSNFAQEQRSEPSNSFIQSEVRQTGTRLSFSKPQKASLLKQFRQLKLSKLGFYSKQTKMGHFLALRDTIYGINRQAPPTC